MSLFSKLKGNGGNGGAERGGYSASQTPKSEGLHAAEVHVDPLLNAAGGYAGMKTAEGKPLSGDELKSKVQQQFGDPEQITAVINHVSRIREEEERRRDQR